MYKLNTTKCYRCGYWLDNSKFSVIYPAKANYCDACKAKPAGTM